jgi:hypothetical protein
LITKFHCLEEKKKGGEREIRKGKTGIKENKKFKQKYNNVMVIYCMPIFIFISISMLNNMNMVIIIIIIINNNNNNNNNNMMENPFN